MAVLFIKTLEEVTDRAPPIMRAGVGHLIGLVFSGKPGKDDIDAIEACAKAALAGNPASLSKLVAFHGPSDNRTAGLPDEAWVVSIVTKGTFSMPMSSDVARGRIISNMRRMFSEKLNHQPA